jgi:hypothetical protein
MKTVMERAACWWKLVVVGRRWKVEMESELHKGKACVDSYSTTMITGDEVSNVFQSTTNET